MGTSRQERTPSYYRNTAFAPMITGVYPDGSPYSMPTTEGTYFPIQYEQITGLGAAKGITPPPGAKLAIIQAEGQGVRWRDDGQNPTATVGMRVEAGGELLYNADLDAIRFIEVAVGGVLNIAYYRT